MTTYDAEYYENNAQDEDRIALRWYSRVLKKMLAEDAKVLDFGCGTGFFSAHLATWADVTAFDVSEVARNTASRRAKSARIVDGLGAIDKGSLDAVVSLHVLEHIQDVAATLVELRSLLKPGGLLFFVVPDSDGRGHKMKLQNWFAYQDPTHCTFFSSGEWVRLTEQCEYSVVLEGSDGLWDSPYSSWMPKILDRLVFGFPLIFNVILGRISRRPNRGECAIIVAKRVEVE